MKSMLVVLIVAVAGTGCPALADSDSDMENRVAALEKEIAELKEALQPVIRKAQAEEIVARQRSAARKRMRKDSDNYSRDELKEIESLYQVANKQWRSREGKDSLKTLVNKYDKANRTGCALLYLGQMSEGSEREKYLKEAIKDFSDCYYGDGVQVGAYARFYLAHYYKEAGKGKKAEKLFKEVLEHYPEAIDHKGALLSTSIEL